MKNVTAHCMIWELLNFNNDTHKDALVTHKPKVPTMFRLQGLMVEWQWKSLWCHREGSRRKEEEINVKVSSVNENCYHRTISFIQWYISKSFMSISWWWNENGTMIPFSPHWNIYTQSLAYGFVVESLFR